MPFLRDIKGQSGVEFKTMPYHARYMTVHLCDGLRRRPYLAAHGSEHKTVVVAMSNCSMAGNKTGDTMFLDDDTEIRLLHQEDDA